MLTDKQIENFKRTANDTYWHNMEGWTDKQWEHVASSFAVVFQEPTSETEQVDSKLITVLSALIECRSIQELDIKFVQGLIQDANKAIVEASSRPKREEITEVSDEIVKEYYLVAHGIRNVTSEAHGFIPIRRGLNHILSKYALDPKRKEEIAEVSDETAWTIAKELDFKPSSSDCKVVANHVLSKYVIVRTDDAKVKELEAEIEQLTKKADGVASKWAESIIEIERLKQSVASVKHGFKNFHSNLCKRFDYHHDENDWERDLASIEEHIAALVKSRQQGPCASSTYGDLVKVNPIVAEMIESHVWDNKNASEQRDWLLKLHFESRQEPAQLAEPTREEAKALQDDREECREGYSSTSAEDSEGSDEVAIDCNLYALQKFFARRNAPKLDPRREIAVKLLRHKVPAWDLEILADEFMNVLAALDKAGKVGE